MILSQVDVSVVAEECGIFILPITNMIVNSVMCTKYWEIKGKQKQKEKNIGKTSKQGVLWILAFLSALFQSGSAQKSGPTRHNQEPDPAVKIILAAMQNLPSSEKIGIYEAFSSFGNYKKLQYT